MTGARTGMVDPADLTGAEKDALRRIAMWKLRRKPGGYGLYGERWKVTLRMVGRLAQLRLVSLLPGARYPVALTGAGRATLAVMDERARRAREQREARTLEAMHTGDWSGMAEKEDGDE